MEDILRNWRWPYTVFTDQEYYGELVSVHCQKERAKEFESTGVDDPWDFQKIKWVQFVWGGLVCRDQDSNMVYLAQVIYTGVTVAVLGVLVMCIWKAGWKVRQIVKPKGWFYEETYCLTSLWSVKVAKWGCVALGIKFLCRIPIIWMSGEQYNTWFYNGQTLKQLYEEKDISNMEFSFGSLLSIGLNVITLLPIFLFMSLLVVS